MSIASFFKKRPREDDAAPASAPVALPQPCTLACFNANSLLNRIEKDGSLLSEFLTVEAPDLLFVSEVRFPATGPPGCKKDDGKPRRRGELSRVTPAQAKEADTITSFLRQHNYRPYWTLSDSKYAGCGLLVRRDRAQPLAVRFSLAADRPTDHTAEGRVILATFQEFDVLGTYSPNNGTTEVSFERRRAWDRQVEAFLRARRCAPSDLTSADSAPAATAPTATAPTATAPTASECRPLIWLGDLNVAHDWSDVGPDPRWFREQNGQVALDAADRGQPGFTENEQSRFTNLLEVGGLVDAYRHLHPTPDWKTDVTWRGTPGVHNPAEGRYYNKGMRIDYVLVCKSLVPRVLTARVHGKGADRAGFLGSDHCPLIVELATAGTERVTVAVHPT